MVWAGNLPSHHSYATVQDTVTFIGHRKGNFYVYRPLYRTLYLYKPMYRTLQCIYVTVKDTTMHMGGNSQDVNRLKTKVGFLPSILWFFLNI